MTIAELRALLEGATPGRWVYERTVSDTLDCDAECVIDTLDPALFNVVHADEADARLICAAVNGLPALLDVAEAAAQFIENDGFEEHTRYDASASYDARVKLRAAIDALKAGKAR